MSDESVWGKTPAQRRHAYRVAWASMAYAVLLIAVLGLYARHGPVAGPWRVLLALLPAAPLVAMFASYARYLKEETDEYIRMLVIRRILAATTVAMTCAVVWGFLSDLGGARPIANYWIAVVWVVVQAAGGLADKWRGA